MRKVVINISQEGHRNPSLIKIRRSTSSQGKKLSMEYRFSSNFAEKAESSMIRMKEKSRMERLFLDRCFEKVSEQNMVLNQFITKKEKQYKNLVGECERIKKIAENSLGYKNYQREDNRDNMFNSFASFDQCLCKENLSSIKSEEESKSSLVSDKLLHSEVNGISIQDLEKQYKSKSFGKSLTRQLKLELENVGVNKIKYR